MKLPTGHKIIGIITADVEEAEGTILWDNHELKQMPDLNRKDILSDVAGLANTAYEDAPLGYGK